VKGRTDPTVIFALVGDEALAREPAFQRLRRSFEAGVLALAEGDAYSALAHFGDCSQGETFGLDEAIRRLVAKAEAMRHQDAS